MKRSLIPGVLWVVLLCGCSTDLYYWGRYQDAIHYAYAHADEWDRSGLIRIMEEDRSRALKAEKPLPPGWHAHLGLLYYDEGQPARALQEFQTEKDLFPESGVFMDRLLGKFPEDPAGSQTNRLRTQGADGAGLREELAGSQGR